MKEKYVLKKGKVYDTSEIPIPKHWYGQLYENIEDDFENIERSAGDISKVDAVITITCKIKPN